MKIVFAILLLFNHALYAQLQNDDPDEIQEQHLESFSEMNDSEPEDEFYTQQLAYYINHPLNINGPLPELNDFPLLEPLLVENLQSYRKLLGDFISVYELQSVPGFSVDVIKILLPYITISDQRIVITALKSRFRGGEKSMLARPSVVPEKSKGFNSPNAASRFQGGRIRLIARYKYQYKNLLQYGVVADQDAGEKFVFNKGQPGFDFYSMHVFARRIGMIKSIALGDYTVNLGQGLFQWQSQAYNKSPGVIAIKRQSEVLRPYHSAGEYNFFRGAGITMEKGAFENTLFVSLRNLSGNLDYDNRDGKIITSLQTSGLHRTVSEIEDRGVVWMTAAGGNLKWKNNHGHMGLNITNSHYSLPLIRREELYNKYAIRGKDWINYGMDFSFTYRNYHFFGELAFDKKTAMATVAGLMASLSREADLAVLVRSISPRYQSIYGKMHLQRTRCHPMKPEYI